MIDPSDAAQRLEVVRLTWDVFVRDLNRQLGTPILGKQAQKAKEEAEKQLAEAVELQVDSYTREVTLQVQVTGLQGMVETYDEVQKVLKSRCSEQADRLERVEGEMATQAKAMALLQVDNDKLQVEVSQLRVEKEGLEKQVASGDAIIEELEKD